MSIRPTKLSWANYKRRLKILSLLNQVLPQQIIGRIDTLLKTASAYSSLDGKGGIKQRNRTAHDARNAQRERRRRIQTGN